MPAVVVQELPVQQPVAQLAAVQSQLLGVPATHSWPAVQPALRPQPHVPLWQSAVRPHAALAPHLHCPKVVSQALARPLLQLQHDWPFVPQKSVVPLVLQVVAFSQQPGQFTSHRQPVVVHERLPVQASWDEPLWLHWQTPATQPSAPAPQGAQAAPEPHLAADWAA
jgi:hypothetical protein